VNNNTMMRPELVNPLLEDIGFESPEEREATKKFCLGALDVGDITCGDLNTMAASFADGYQACLQRS